MSRPRRIVVIHNECPVPANHGGRIDVYRRLLALREAGVEVSLIYWQDVAAHGALQPQHRAQLDGLVARHLALDMRSSKLDLAARILGSPWCPSHVRARQPRPAEWRRVLALLQGVPHDGILLDSLYGGLLALRLQQHLKLPLLYRSHNIEQVYMRKQASKAVGWRKKLPIALNLMALPGYERNILKRSLAFFDISDADLQWWRQQGLHNGHWMPPIMDSGTARNLSLTEGWAPTHDVGYVGNLYSPNNVEGVCWFLAEVVPRLRAQHPGLTAFVAGSKPTAAVLDAARQQGVDIIANPPDMAPIIRSAKVLVNPVFAGSGVNIKAVEMLFSPAALVSTSVGLGGLPADVRDQFSCADQPEAFAHAILQHLNACAADDSAHRSRRAAARARFQQGAIQPLLQTIDSLPCP